MKRVALLLGCVQEVLEPSINQRRYQAAPAPRRRGVDAERGGLLRRVQHHLGRENETHDRRRGAMSMPGRARSARGRLDAILTTASGCGTMVKDYGHLLARDRGYAERATEIAEARPRHHRVHL